MRVRYIVNDITASIPFYTRKLGFQVNAQTPGFAMLQQGNLLLVLSPPTGKGPGGASQPMPSGQKTTPGGWDRIILQTNDIVAQVATLRKAGVHFRNDITGGPGGRQIVLDDPSGNPIELFQPEQ